ncbi:Oxysterol-binding protein 1 [Holothuria leucospilota]|uniref:Oxysterol-binding protein n=1 Tax=Holothuria leucospilota TaxID=206669 RepID=A0A9Q1CFI0_HOLLE|nr:Oxysterol-binding protein 1 [Holothuria leucospilota]
MHSDTKGNPPDNMKGWLYKWTNYIKGYQRRWFVLSNGLLSYYRSQAEMAHSCRGSINLMGAFIDVEDSCTFVISCDAQTFHLRANNEVEKQKWVVALEVAKANAIQMMDAESDEEMESANQEEIDYQSSLRQLTSKLDDMNTCNDLIEKHFINLQRSLSELEKNPEQDTAERSKIISERATLFKITSNAMINACHDFLELGQTQGRKWQKILQNERDKRAHLEETIETLAKQHNKLEKACREAKTLDSIKTEGVIDAGDDASEEDEENEFFDAVDEPAFPTTVEVPGPRKGHRRTPSGTSGLSIGSNEGFGGGDQEMPSSDEDMQVSSRLEATVVPASSSQDGSSQVSNHHVIKRTSTGRARRTKIPEKPNISLDLWSIIKNCIGKELSRIPMPVNVNEPLSMLQRVAEDFEYSHILDEAALCEDTCEELARLAAFTISCYGNSNNRATKPFNPLLGETFECDRQEEQGWRFFAEQVSHHPPAAASHCESKDWTSWVDITITSKFRGKYLQVFPKGTSHVTFKRSGSHYTYGKVMVTVHNIIVGKLWVDLSGESEIYNHTTKECCRLVYKPSTYFARDTPRKVTGVVVDASGAARYIVSGTWDRKVEIAKVLNERLDKSGKGKPVYETGPPQLVWQRKPPPSCSEKMYNMSEMALTLNELEPGVAPTDSRFRPDQRLMEDGHWNEANKEKLRLEEKQRAKRRKKEAEIAESGGSPEVYRPNWFERRLDPYTNTVAYYFTEEYWKAKEKKDWERCPDIF